MIYQVLEFILIGYLIIGFALWFNSRGNDNERVPLWIIFLWFPMLIYVVIHEIFCQLNGKG